jgi:ribosomal protein S18 acetylase RimI-like enzyme
MTLTYRRDKTNEYDESIIESLVEYNTSQTGERKRAKRYLYVFNNDQLVGFAHLFFGWDWIHLNAYCYQETSVLYTLLNEGYRLFGDDAQGCLLSTFTPFIIDDFFSANYQIIGHIDDVPKGYKKVMLTQRDLTPLPSLDYTVKISENELSEYKNMQQKMMSSFLKKSGVSKSKEDLSFVCLDGEKVVGGVIAVAKLDSIYVDILYVDEHYRGQHIGVKLMSLVEEHAHRNKILKIYLGTASFQAPRFYPTSPRKLPVQGKS